MQLSLEHSESGHFILSERQSNMTISYLILHHWHNIIDRESKCLFYFVTSIMTPSPDQKVIVHIL